MKDDEESLATYLAEVRRLPVLTAENESLLLAATRDGSEETKKRLVEGYLELVAFLALRLAPLDMRPLDAIQEAPVVLMRLLEDKSVAAPAHELTPALVRHYGEIQRR